MKPDITTATGTVAFTWAAWALTMTLTRFRDGSRGPTCELTASVRKDSTLKTLTSGVIALATMPGRDRLAARLKKLYQTPDWDLVIETICVRGLQEFRKSDPTQYLEGQAEETVECFVLNPLLYARHPTLLYGPGDTGKSFFGLYCACLLSVGGSENGLCCSDWPTLYLDWELAYQEMDVRLTLLKHGHPAFGGVRVAYKRLHAPLSDCLEEIRTTIRETGAQVLILDSLALAAGAELERAETAIRFHQALRELETPALLIGHTAKNAEEKTPFGSVFFFNLARNVWEVKKTQEPNSGMYRFGLYHRKCNLGPRRNPLGFQVTIQDGACRIETADLSEEPELRSGLPLHGQIEAALKAGTPLTVKALADQLGAKDANIRTTLARYKGKKWIQLTSTSGQEAEWTTI